MRMRLMLLGGGNAPGQALIRLGAEEDIGFLAPRPPEQGWDAASLTTLLDETRPDAVINLAFYHDWFQAEQVEAERLGAQERAVERLAELCQHYEILLVQPSSYRVFDGARATAYSEKDETLPLGLRGQALWRMEQSVRAACPRHVLIRFGWLLDESPNGLLGRFQPNNRAVPRRRPARQPDAGGRRRAGGARCSSSSTASAAVGHLPLRRTGSDHHPGAGTGDPQRGAYLSLQPDPGAFGGGPCRAPGRARRAAARGDGLQEDPPHLRHQPRAWRAGLPALLDRYYRHV